MSNKVTIIAKGKRISLDMSTQEKADALFWQIVSRFMPTVEVMPLANPTPALPKVPLKIPPPVLQTDKISAEKPLVEAFQGSRYKCGGFLYIKCDHCDNLHGFCAKEPISKYFCGECMQTTQFTQPLTPLKFKCECGRSFKYLTNLSTFMFDINCFDCQSPVSVEYNAKLKEYVGIKR